MDSKRETRRQCSVVHAPLCSTVRVQRVWCCVAERAVGFTLVEMLVVISIITIMTTVVIANFRKSQPTDALRAAASEIAAEFQRLQAYALSGSFEDPDAIRYGFARVGSDATEYFVVSTNARCPDFTESDACVAAGDMEITTKKLPDRVLFVSATPTAVFDVGGDPIFFVGYDAPRGVLFRLGNDVPAPPCPPTAACITLGYERSDVTKTITINTVSGRVDVE